MKLSDSLIEKLLRKSGQIAEEELEKISTEAEKTHHSLQDLVIERGVVTEEFITKQYAEYTGFPYVKLEVDKIPKETLGLIPERIAQQYKAILFARGENGSYQLAMDDPDDVQAVDFLKKQFGGHVEIYVTTHEDVMKALDRYRGDVAEELSNVIDSQTKEEEEKKKSEAAANVTNISEDSPISQTVNLILEYAIRGGASDIHIEPRETFVQIRYRIDGVLQEANKLPKNVLDALVSRIKILANLKIDERRVPQDGRFKTSVSGHTYALRVSTLPIADGEKVVMRVLDETNRALTLEQLGYWGHSIKTIKNAILQPHGIILVTGPTGSGKSTSLLSVLSMLNSSEVNISTVEDPVEYKIAGINQTQVNPKAGMTFAGGLRALLRQDPNIIMVGEIRDGETADLAVQAALTGHLVLSTLHTNNAATALPRLLEMGIEPFLIASTVRAIVGQRLVRRINPKSRDPYHPSSEELEEVNNTFHLKEEGAMKHIHELEKLATSQGIGASLGEELSSTETSIERLFKVKEDPNDPKNTGYKGRMGIYEVLENTLDIQKMIVARATSEEIQDQAVREGMDTMQMDGLIKALRGETSIEETLRVTRE